MADDNKKDFLILCPLYYSVSTVERFYLFLQKEASDLSYDVAFPSSNADLVPLAQKKCETYGYHCHLRENLGGGEGAFWWLQNQSGINLKNYKYLIYFEESCHPIRAGWFSIIKQRLRTEPIVGWHWFRQGKKRSNVIEVRYSNGPEYMSAFLNKGHELYEGESMFFIYDTPCFRHELISFSMDDFIGFRFPSPTEPYWAGKCSKHGVRFYGIRSERMYWDLKDKDKHGIDTSSPNIQWHILMKHKYIPPNHSLLYNYFRELTIDEKITGKINKRLNVPKRKTSIARIKAVINSKFFRRTNQLTKGSATMLYF